MTRSVFRRRCPNADTKDSRKKIKMSLMQTNVHPVCPIRIDTKWHGECWPDFEEGELDGEDLPSVCGGRNVVPGERGNIVEPEGNLYVTSGQSPEASSRFTPWRSRFTPIGRLVPSLPDAQE